MMAQVKSTSRFVKPALMIGGLIVLFFLVQWFVHTFRNPNQMGIVESMAMDMTVQVPQGAMPVEMETVGKEPFSAMVTYTGTVDAYNDIPIYARTEGWVTSTPVYAGDTVKKGQLLVQLDTAELTSRLTRNKALKQKSQQAIQAAKADLDYWTEENKRSQALLKEEVITQEEHEQTQAKFATAQSTYDQALHALDAATASEQTQAIQLGYTTIRAPESGVITKRQVDQGVLIKPGMELMHLTQLNPVRVQAHVAESDANTIAVGGSVLIWKSMSAQENPIKATITAVFPEREQGTRTSIVEALVPNPDQRFVQGDFVTMAIQAGQPKDTLTIASSAVIDKDQQQAVWVAENGKASLRYVTTGGHHGNRTSVTHGLNEGDVVITRGYEDLNEGSPIIAGEYGPDGLTQLPEVTSNNRLTKANHYRVNQSLKHMAFQASLNNPPPHRGHNELLLDVTPLHGKLPQKLSIDVHSYMPAMPKMDVPTPLVQGKKDGTFVVKTHFTMPGLWQLDVVIKQGKKTLAETTLQIEVPE